MSPARVRPRTLRGCAWALALLLAACGSGGTVSARGELVVPVRQLDFGDVPVLNTRAQELEVRNFGRAPLVVEEVSLREVGTPFTVIEAPSAIEPGAGARVIVAFRPERIEAFAATLVLRTDDDSEPSVEIALTGRGFTQARLEIEPEALRYEAVCEGGEAVQRLRLRSTGTADLIIEQLRFKDGTAPEFQFISSTTTPATVAQGDELLISVRYSPTETSPDRSEGAILLASTDPDRRAVEIPIVGTVNRAPRAVIADVANAAPGATVELDGSASADPEGQLPLQFAWSIKASPLGSRSRPTPADAPKTNLLLDLPGAFTLQLKVTDAAGCVSKPAFKEVSAIPAEQLLVELVWDNPDTDFDLHMVPEGEDFFAPKDCYFAEGHMRPDWGVQGDPSDDPSLDRDALTGYGPEIISYPNPANGRYRVMVHFFSAHRSKAPATTATLRIYEFGVVRSETRRLMVREDQKWIALSVDWPSGTITPIDELE